MKIEKIQTKIYTLTQEEADIFERALTYVRHRIINHNKDGGVASLEKVEALLKELNR